MMPMFPSSSVSPVLLATLLLLVPAMSASPASPHQLSGLQFLLSSFASPWPYPMNELLQGLPMHPGCPSINPFCLTPGCPKEPGPSALCLRAAFANSQVRVMPGPSSLCYCPGYGPVPCAPWATTPCTPHTIDHLTCNPTLTPIPVPEALEVPVLAGGGTGQTDSGDPC